jgi:hypothetical protein
MSATTAGRYGSVASTTESSTGRTGGLSRAAVLPLGTFGTARRAWYTVAGTSSFVTAQRNMRRTVEAR